MLMKILIKAFLWTQILCPILNSAAAAHSNVPTSTSTAFVVVSSRIVATRSTRHFRKSGENVPVSAMMMLPDDALITTAVGFSSSLVTSAVEFFDGSTIADPVVVSSAFWTTLKAKLIWLVVGQLIAIVVFAILASVAASQMSNILESIAGAFPLPEIKNRNQPKRLEVPPELSSGRPQPNWTKLAVCIAVDVIGSSSEVIPLVGELSDFLYAPIAATILRSLYGSNIVFALEFIEEILPFTDILPLATICWVVDTFATDSDLAKLLQIGRYGPINDMASSGGAVIDVKVAEENSPKRLLKQNSDDDIIK